MTAFLADENVPFAAIRALQSDGWDILTVEGAGLRGRTDPEVMGKARESNRTLLTLDKHFADILSYPPGSHPGIVFIRIHPPLASAVATALRRFLASSLSMELNGNLIVLEKEGVRIRRFRPLD